MNNQMIPLTVANTLDQSVKQRIEARGQQTVKQAVQEAKMAPQGQFDVFDGLGKVVSNQPVDQFRDKTIYIGVQKVASQRVAGGGCVVFPHDWEDEGIDLDDIDLDEIDQPIRKSVTLILPFGGNRQEIEPQGDETLIEAAERIGLRPRDGIAIGVWDAAGDVVSNRRARDMIGRSFGVFPLRLSSCGGLPLDRLNELRVEFPSIRPVRQYTDGTKTDMVVLQFPSGVRTSSGFWRVAILSNGNGYTPFILNKTEVIQGTSPFVRGETVIPGTNNTGLGICQGGIMAVLNHLSKDPVARMGAYINHVQNLLNE